jgi:hypothetical protein
MAEPPGMDYVATEIVTDPDTGARAYNPGDLVHESAIESGNRLGLQVGVNVRLREGASPSRPARNAPTALWVDYAVSEGLDRDRAEGLSRKDLIAAYGEDATAAGRAAAEGETGAAD